MDDILLEPLKAFNEYYEKVFDDNAEEYFSDLVDQSGLDVDANRATVSEYNKEVEAADRLQAKLNGKRTGKNFLIALIVIGVLAMILGGYQIIKGASLIWITSVALGAVAFIVPIVCIFKILNPQMSNHKEEIEQRRQRAQKLKNEAYNQMQCLNDLFESNATKKLIEKTVPKLVIDDNFDMRRYDYLNGKYGFAERNDKTRSTIAILTGEILGNPFIVDRELVETMGTQDYTGSLVISWTTTYTDSKGQTHTNRQTQTLYATVTKPRPYYNEQTCLIYGNEAAPRLTFTHEPSHAERMNDKQLQHYVKSGAKKIQRKQRKDVSVGSPAFTEMGNAEFDVLFGALDRDNEVEFRLLFTPLAQKNMLELMKSNQSFGDDFYFRKERCINYVSSEHSARWDLDTSYKRYQSYDIDESYNSFMSFNSQYFKSLYFDLAPLLAIPLYQQQKPHEYIYKTEYQRNYTTYETECVVNKMGADYFAPQFARTPSILKTNHIGKLGQTDKVNVIAYAYQAENRVDYVPVFGGDGLWHNVPVPWVEYIPVSQMSTVNVKQLELSDRQFKQKREQDDFVKALANNKAYSFYHKLLCVKVNEDDSGDSFDKDIDKALN